LGGHQAAAGGDQPHAVQPGRDDLLATSNDRTISLYDVASGIRLGDPVVTAAPYIVPGRLHPDGLSFAETWRVVTRSTC
jgi:hypothetical protein